MIARPEDEMTRLPAVSNCILLLCGTDREPDWNNGKTEFVGKVYAGEYLEVKYIVSEKKEGKGYGILAVDCEKMMG